MEKISVFGGTGFIGSAFVKKYHDKCIAIPRDVRQAPTNNVLYLISTVDNYNVFTDLTLDVRTNLITLLETLEHCKRTNMVFNFVSSWFVYGTCELPATENTLCNPTGFYSITKYTAEKLLVSFCETFNVRYRILRLGNIYGAGDLKTSKKKNAIQFMVSQIAENKPVDLYEGGNVIRDLLHIDDAVRAINLVIENGELDTVYNIGSGKPTYLKNLIDIAIKMTNSSSEISAIPTPDFHKKVQAKDFYLNTSKLESLGFNQEISLEDGLRTLLYK